MAQSINQVFVIQRRLPEEGGLFGKSVRAESISDCGAACAEA